MTLLLQPKMQVPTIIKNLTTHSFVKKNASHGFVVQYKLKNIFKMKLGE